MHAKRLWVSVVAVNRVTASALYEIGLKKKKTLQTVWCSNNEQWAVEYISKVMRRGESGQRGGGESDLKNKEVHSTHTDPKSIKTKSLQHSKGLPLRLVLTSKCRRADVTVTVSHTVQVWITPSLCTSLLLLLCFFLSSIHLHTSWLLFFLLIFKVLGEFLGGGFGQTYIRMRGPRIEHPKK